MEARGAVIRLESLTKRYGRVLALDGLSMEVLPGEVLGFLGPNGAGKTTTLRLLMGYLRPTAGSAQVHGLDSWRDRVAVHARTGYLPGDLRLWPRLSTRAIAGHLAGSAATIMTWIPPTSLSGWTWTWTGRWASCPRATARRPACCSRSRATRTYCCSMSPPAGWTR